MNINQLIEKMLDNNMGLEYGMLQAYDLGRAVGAKDTITLLEDQFNDTIDVAALYEQKAYEQKELKEIIAIEEA